MPSPGQGKLAKLTITAYKDLDRKTEAGTFEAMYNPSSLSQKYEIAYGKKQALASTGISAKYLWSKPRTLSLELILDGTRVHQPGIAQSKHQQTVTERVNEFLDLTYRMSSASHQPTFLTVEWGELDWGEQHRANRFSCRLAGVDITYTDFNSDGSPLRAKLNVSLISDVEATKRAREEKKSSPDLTHRKIVRAGDTLPLLTKEIYGSAKHYLFVARANDLDDFRNLDPGRELIFPPLTQE